MPAPLWGWPPRTDTSSCCILLKVYTPARTQVKCHHGLGLKRSNREVGLYLERFWGGDAPALAEFAELDTDY